MSIDKLVEALEKEAQSSQEEILEEARLAVEKINESAKGEVYAFSKQIKSLREKLARRKELLSTSRQKREMRRKQNQLENLYIDEIKKNCFEQYSMFMAGIGYKECLIKVYELALLEVGEVSEIIADKKTLEILKTLKPKSKLSVDTSASLGFVMISGDGTFKLVNTFESSYEKAWRKFSPFFVNKIIEVLGDEF